MTRPSFFAEFSDWWRARPRWLKERRSRAYAARCEPLAECLFYGAANAARTHSDVRIARGPNSKLLTRSTQA
jgi:hypothetical protein